VIASAQTALDHLDEQRGGAMSDLDFGFLCIHLGGGLGAIAAAAWRAVPWPQAIVLSILFMGASSLAPWQLGFIPGALWDDLAVGIVVGAIAALAAGRLLAVPLRSTAAIMILCCLGMAIGGVWASRIV
jgi:hypothetical protein